MISFASCRKISLITINPREEQEELRTSKEVNKNVGGDGIQNVLCYRIAIGVVIKTNHRRREWRHLFRSHGDYSDERLVSPDKDKQSLQAVCWNG